MSRRMWFTKKTKIVAESELECLLMVKLISSGRRDIATSTSANIWSPDCSRRKDGRHMVLGGKSRERERNLHDKWVVFVGQSREQDMEVGKARFRVPKISRISELWSHIAWKYLWLSGASIVRLFWKEMSGNLQPLEFVCLQFQDMFGVKSPATMVAKCEFGEKT